MPLVSETSEAECPLIHLCLPKLFNSSFNNATNVFDFALLPFTNLEKADKTAVKSLRDIWSNGK